MSVAASQILRPSAPRAVSPVRAVFARVEVFDDPAQALDAWRELSPEKLGSFYQTERFVLSWLDHFGAREKARPFFIVARDHDGAALALLPLGLFRLGPLRLAKFLGGKHSNYNLGLFRAGYAFGANDLKALLRAAARKTPSGPHLYCLRSLPLVWRGIANPLGRLPFRPAASNAHATSLPSDGEAFLAGRLSADTRKKLRKKEKRLAAMGALRVLRACDADQAREILDAFFAHKNGRAEFAFSEQERDARRRFYGALAAFDGGAPTVELHALALDNKIIATLATGSNGGRMQGMFISYDPDPEIAKSSPGQILLCHVLRDACARSFSAFDLGAGDVPYKTTFCDEFEPLVDVFYAPSWAGRLAQPFFAAASAAKAAVKRHPLLLDRAMQLRARFNRWRASSE